MTKIYTKFTSLSRTRIFISFILHSKELKEQKNLINNLFVFNSQSTRQRKMLQRSFSRQEGTGKKLPPTPSKPSRVILGRKPASLPATPARQLPRTRTPSEESYYKSEYNEDYNHAYRSEDNLQQDTFTESVYPEQIYNQSHITGSVPDNQHVRDHFAPQMTDQYGQSYVDPPAKDLYIQGQPYAQNSYKDAYQPFVDTNSQIYQERYQKTTYPTISESNDQFEKTQDIVTDNYQSMDYDQGNIDQLSTQQNLASQNLKSQSQLASQMHLNQSHLTQPYPSTQPQVTTQYQQDYKLESFTDIYTNYTIPVSASVYDQNNVLNYDPYKQNLYDNKYDAVTSDPYQETYPESYYQPVVSAPEEVYSESYGTQETYQQSYEKTDYQDYIPYSKEEDTTDYKNDYQSQYQDQEQYQNQDLYQNKDQYQIQDQYQSQDQYQDQNRYPYQEQCDKSYQDSYQGSFEEYNKDLASSERRKSEVPELSVTTPRGQTKTNGYPSNESEYFYPCQEKPEISLTGAARRKKLGKRDTSPLFQQNTDSLESRDDELKDSFETAVSSVSSSQPRKAHSEYSTAGESSPAPATLVESPPSCTQVSNMLNHVTNHISTVPSSASVHPSISTNGKRLSRTDTYQEDIIEDEYHEVIQNDLQRKDSQMSQQSQMSHQSQLSQHSSQQSQKPKLTRGESYISDNYSEDGYTDRRDSYAQQRKESYSSTTQEAFKPPLQRTDSYQSRELNGVRASGYGQNFTAPQPISRAESYKRGYFKDQDSIDKPEISLSNAVNEDYKMRDETLERCVF